jgi:hypothetical protein
MYWGLLLTCRIVNPHIDVIWRGYGWFLERVNVVIGCSDVVLRPNGSLWVALAFYHGSIMNSPVKEGLKRTCI